MSAPVPTDAELIALLDAYEREMSVVISNPALPDNPMIYVSEEFEAQTGYTPEEALGRNCRFLQGPGTDPDAILAIIDAVMDKNAGQVEQFRAGKDKVFGFFVGQVMRETKGKADPAATRDTPRPSECCIART